MINAFVVVSEPPEINKEINLIKSKSKSKTVSVILILLLVFLWGVLGIAAFFMSLVCFGKSGTTSQHILGFLLAIFFGPFYWIYYGVVRSYCVRM
jgi:hypothetical protein